MSAIEKLSSHATDFTKAVSHERQLNTDADKFDPRLYESFYHSHLRFQAAANAIGFEYSVNLAGDESEQMFEIVEAFNEYIAPVLRQHRLDLLASEAASEYAEYSPGLTSTIKVSSTTQDKLHQLLSAARSEVRDADIFDEKHKSRILLAINAVQTEIDKPVSNFHLLLGSIEDIAETIGKAGRRVKPAVDRLVEAKQALKKERQESLEIAAEKKPRAIPDLRDDVD